jgi:hypothetical protein
MLGNFGHGLNNTLVIESLYEHMVQELCWLFCEGGMSSNSLWATLIPSKHPFEVAYQACFEATAKYTIFPSFV